MNKKVAAIVGTVAVGSLLLGASAYAAVSGTSGYDIYKQALKNTVAATSMAPTTHITLKDNGKVLATASAVTKMNQKNETMSNELSLAVGDKTQTFDIYRQKDKLITKNSDSSVYNEVYNLRQHREGQTGVEQAADSGKATQQTADQRAARKAEKVQELENVFDAFSTNFQNYISTNVNSDGTTAVSLKMSDNQISPTVNALTSVLVKNAINDKLDGEQHNDFAGRETGIDNLLVKELQGKLPQLVSNIKVNTVQVDATVSTANLITGQKEYVTISGTDASGQNHVVEITVDTSVTGYNATTPDTVDLTGKQVKAITGRKGHGFEHGEAE